MKSCYDLLLIPLLFVTFNCCAQTEITPQILQNIKQGVEKQVPGFKHKLLKQHLTNTEITFAADTFRIERTVDKMMETDGSTAGTNEAMDYRTNAYDKLMNRYYNKLMALLNTADKKTLIDAQRAWLKYRDADKNLIWKIGEEHYSGGGSIQSNIASARYSHLVIERTKTIFEYYDGAISDR